MEHRLPAAEPPPGAMARSRVNAGGTRLLTCEHMCATPKARLASHAQPSYQEYHLQSLQNNCSRRSLPQGKISNSRWRSLQR